MSAELTERVNFEIIRYANCWEDAEILLEGLCVNTGDKILSIGSAGDNSFSLLTTDPELVVAVDINRTQLYLIELKKVCFKLLTHEELLLFLGFKACDNRLRTFSLIKRALRIEARNYWEKNIPAITQGIINSGKFENYLRLFSNKILPWIHDQATVAELFDHKPAKEQEQFYSKKWDTWRWKLFFKIFFSKYIMGKFGRDPEFLKEVTVPVADYIYKRAALQIKNERAQQNFILHFNLTGNFGALLPHYVREENFEKIKSNLDRLLITQGYAQDALDKYGKFNAMNLSNIFEYMNKDLFKQTAESLLKGAEQGARLGYWNLMVPRKIAEIVPGKVMYEENVSQLLSEKDKGFFYNQFIIEQVR
jgi:S-adenosylmethionine-diacylglycerol 3-amino-3-carboxypropyl transferase